MRILSLLLLASLFVAPTAAQARGRAHVRFYVPAPAVRVVVNPWAYGYRPAARAGWTWVEGYYAQDGSWVPGYWAPAYQRPGYVWVAGHWEGDRYLDGYWREIARPGWTWVDGYYDRGGRWVQGYWAPAGPPQGPPPAPPAYGPDSGPPSEPPADEPPPAEPPSDVYHDYDG